MKPRITLIILTFFVTLTVGAAQNKQDAVRALMPGEAVERELRGGETHRYKTDIKQGEFLRAIIEQRGIDVVVVLLGPEGKQLVEADSPNDDQGSEPLFWIAATTGTYHFEVRSLDKNAAAGRYEVKLAEVRASTENDKKRVAAQVAFAQATNLFGQRTAEARQKAVERFKEVLPQWEAAPEPERQGLTLNSIGVICSSLGEKQKALEYYSQALPIRRAVGDRSGEATTLNNIGVIYHSLGEKQKALEYYRQALPIRRAVGDRKGEANALRNIGRVYDSLGEKQKAFDYYNQALPIYRAVADRSGEATTLIGIGLAYYSLGENAKALDSYHQALTIHRGVGNRQMEANTLNNIGLVYRSLGEMQKALEYYNQVLPIARAMGDRGGEATTLSNIGFVYSSLGENAKALEYYNQALPIRRAVGDRSGEAATLNNIGLSYYSLRENAKALEYYNQALPIRRAVGDRSGEATTLNNIGLVYRSLGEMQKALEYYNQALPIYRAIGNRSGEATTFDLLMRLWKNLDRPRIAIFYGKQAVNAYQDLRANIQTLDKEIQKTFARSKEDTYRRLAELLITQSRLVEAQNVLDLLKEEEYFDFVRRDSLASPTTGRAELSPDEAKAKEKQDSVTVIGTKLSDLVSKAQRIALTSEEVRLRDSCLRQLESAEADFQSALGAMAKHVGSVDKSSTVIMKEIEEERGLMDDLRELGPNTVALYTLVGEETYHVILMTPTARVAREYPIQAADLNKKIFAFREAIQNPKLDPLPLAQELHKILVAPVAKDLQGAKTNPNDTLTLMWQLDGVLRYVPVAALHDGKSYLVERYRNVIYTPASKARLKDAVSAHWKGLGLGVSKEHRLADTTFPALPAVPVELDSIIREEAEAGQKQGAATGVLPGKKLLDENFKAEALKEIRLRYQLVHIASHFQFKAGDETKSYLLLGDGTAFTLEQMRKSGMLFSGVDLLTLSACNTALSDKDSKGKEIEGFGVMAQQQGAKAVVATLWPVADESTSLLMQEFYRQRETSGGLTKAEALRQAQLALLHGRNKAARASKEKRADPVPTTDEDCKLALRTFKTDPRRPYAHPHYWAPFILIGNWK